MSDKKKEKIKTLLVIIMIISLVGAFILFFMVQYKLAFVFGGLFMALASFLSQWTSIKNADYIYRKNYKNNFTSILAN